MTICNPVCENNHCCFRFFFLILHFIVPHEWIEDCFQENFTLEVCVNNNQDKFIEWFAVRNKICKEMKASKAQGNSIPHKMNEKDNSISIDSPIIDKSLELKLLTNSMTNQKLTLLNQINLLIEILIKIILRFLKKK